MDRKFFIYNGYLTGGLLQYEQALRPHVEKQVYDAEIGQETKTLLKHLVIGDGAEGRILRTVLFLGVNTLTEVVWFVFRGCVVGGCPLHVWFEVDETAYQTAKCFIEVCQKFVLLLVEGTEVIFVVFKEGSVIVGRFQCVPMQVTPVAVVGDAYVAQRTLQTIRFDSGYREGQHPVGCSDVATVAIGLLYVVVILLHVDLVVGQQLSIVLDGCQIGGRKVGDGFHFKM